MEKKRIAVLEPDDNNKKKKKLSTAECLTLVNTLLRAEGLKPRERTQLEKLKLDLVSEETAEGIVSFFKDFLESEEMTRLIFEGFKNYARSLRRNRKRTKKG